MVSKITVDAHMFSEALLQVSSVLRHMGDPVLHAFSEVLVRCRENRCVLTGTDLNTWLVKEIPAQGDDLAFVFKRTREIAKACQLFNGELTLEVSDTGEGDNRSLNLCMRCGNRIMEFEALEPGDHQDYTPIEAETTFSINAAALLKRVERVGYAAPKSKGGCRPSTSGVQMAGHQVYALDGMRLACDTDEHYSFPRPFMVYGDALSYLKIFGDEEVSISLGKYRGEIRHGDTTIGFRVPGDDVFHVEKAIPQKFQEKFSVVPKAFLRELNYLKRFSSKLARPYVRFHAGTMVMPGMIGKYRTTVEIVGENKITFAFNLHYMIDAIKQFKDEPLVTMKVDAPLVPIVIEAEGRSDMGIICTVRLSEKLLAA